tara:strand:- start:2072 stop:2551 length:480 start_codon:yes stop_codon:yes gene_type:complete
MIKKPSYIILDVDGVMTTGKFLYSSTGKIFKEFGAHDNDGIKLVKQFFKIQFITADKRGYLISKKRIVDDMKQSLKLIPERQRYDYLNKKFGLKNIVYFGDGIFDAKILKNCAFGIAPQNATTDARKSADFITKRNSGDGAVLEGCIKILSKYKIKFDI